MFSIMSRKLGERVVLVLVHADQVKIFSLLLRPKKFDLSALESSE
jgi:hypothetical protein